MLHGVIIVNGGLKTPKFEEITALYQAAAAQQEMVLEVYDNNQMLCELEADSPLSSKCGQADFVLFLDKDI